MIRREVRRYLATTLRLDLVAGLTVAMVAIPQSMAYAQLAALPPIYGLYAVVVPAIVGSLAGSSSHLITGASNATSLATAGVLAAFLLMPNYPEYTFVVAILTGLIRLALGLLHMGTLMRYVSNSVLTGLLAAVGVLIILNQTPSLLGIARPASSSTITTLLAIFAGIRNINPYAVVSGLVAMLVLILARRLQKHAPSALLAIVAAGLLVYITGWHDLGVRTVSDLSALNQVGVRFHIPRIPLDVIPGLLAGSLALAVFSLMEAVNIAKAIGIRTDQRIDSSREFIGQGLASLVGGFFQSMPTSGSPARTTVNFLSGAVTRMAGVFSGGFVWAALLLLTPFIGAIPIPSLAGVVIVSAFSIFNADHIRRTWQTRDVSRLVLITTFVSTLLLPLHYAIYVGVALSILIYLYESSRLRMTYLTLNEQGLFVEHPATRVMLLHPKIALINIEGALYFGASEDLEEQLIKTFNAGVKVVILRMRRVHLLASTGVAALEHVLRQARSLGIEILICGVNAEIDPILAASGLYGHIGRENTFAASQTLFSATIEALEAARRKVGAEAVYATPGIRTNHLLPSPDDDSAAAL